MKEILVVFIISFNVLLISGKELEFTRYYFRRKSTWGKAVNRAEWKCREEKCQHFELGLLKDICIRKCISPDCYQELYAWNELQKKTFLWFTATQEDILLYL